MGWSRSMGWPEIWVGTEIWVGPKYGLGELFGQICKYELVLNAENRKENWELDLRKQCNFGCGDFYHIQTELNE